MAGCRSGDAQTLTDLRALLVRALRAALAGRVPEPDALAEDFAQDALLSILTHMDSFRGEARFTTWAAKVAVRHATGQLRRHRWADVSLDALQARGTPPVMPDAADVADAMLEQAEAVAIVRRLVATVLTDRQRTAIEAELVHGVAPDVVAEWMGTNRNALYKLYFDARVRLRQALADEGLSADDLLGPG